MREIFFIPFLHDFDQIQIQNMSKIDDLINYESRILRRILNL